MPCVLLIARYDCKQNPNHPFCIHMNDVEARLSWLSIKILQGCLLVIYPSANGPGVDTSQIHIAEKIFCIRIPDLAEKLWEIRCSWRSPIDYRCEDPE